MTAYDVERRLVAVLERHAEDAMSETDTQTLHEILMIGRQDDPGPGHGPHRLVATAVAAAAVAAAGVVVLWSAGSGRGTSSPDPADSQERVETVAVADAFVHAIVAADTHRAALFMASGHEPWAGWRASLRRDIAWEADYHLAPCRVVAGPGPGTRVDCPYSVDFLTSDEVGADPFHGNAFEVQVVDGEIVWVEDSAPWEWDAGADDYLNGLRGFIDQHHAADADFLRTDERDVAHEDWTRWSDLWRQYAAEYAESAQG